MPDHREKVVLAIHEASGQDITFSNVAFALVAGGGKHGQGYPCILEEVWRTSSTMPVEMGGAASAQPSREITKIE